ncbi:50S ribosomal protein L4 [bacterium]|nr:50S ribosomal protein L4 [bacterium]
MKLPVVNLAGTGSGEAEIADQVLIRDGKGSQAVHDAVVAYLANQRQGTAKVKQMSEVAGSGKKPWRQKGTGRARAGSFASPLWRGGGVVFGPHPRDYTLKVPRKVRALAFRKALSERLLAGDVVVVDDLTLADHKTKALAQALAKLAGADASLLLVADKVDRNLRLAARNLARVVIEPADSVNVYQLLRADKIVASTAALARLQARMEQR